MSVSNPGGSHLFNSLTANIWNTKYKKSIAFSVVLYGLKIRFFNQMRTYQWQYVDLSKRKQRGRQGKELNLAEIYHFYLCLFKWTEHQSVDEIKLPRGTIQRQTFVNTVTDYQVPQKHGFSCSSINNFPKMNIPCSYLIGLSVTSVYSRFPHKVLDKCTND
jgi:hypothetical protein